jgi:hypothetical protein
VTAPEPDLSNLSAAQRFHWRLAAEAARAAHDADINALPAADRSLLFDKTRAALDDILHTMLDCCGGKAC